VRGAKDCSYTVLSIVTTLVKQRMTTLFETKSKPIPITKEMVREAYRQVKANKGSAGVDEEDLAQF